MLFLQNVKLISNSFSSKYFSEQKAFLYEKKNQVKPFMLEYLIFCH